MIKNDDVYISEAKATCNPVIHTGLFLTAPEEYVFDSKSFNATSYAFSFNFNKIFTSNEQLCRTDRWTKQKNRCSRMGGHQCMPGIPDVLAGILVNIVWEHYCVAYFAFLGAILPVQ